MPPARPILQPLRKRVEIELLNCVCVWGGEGGERERYERNSKYHVYL